MLFRSALLLSTLTLMPLFGCASFSGRELPTYTYDQIENTEKKVSVSFNVRAFDLHGENKSGGQFIEKEAQKVLNLSSAFAKVEPNKTDGEYHYTFYFRSDLDADHQGFSRVNAIFSGFTLLILPIYVRDNYILSVDVKQGDNVIRTYTYREHMNTWIEALLLFVMPLYWPPDTWQSITDNMLMNFVHDFSNDLKSGTLMQADKGFELPAKPDQNNAIIYVVRPSAYSHWGASIFLDDKKQNSEIGFNRGSQYIHFRVTPGRHKIYSEGDPLVEVTIEAKGGDIFFIRQDEKANGRGCCNISLIDPQEGRYQVRNSQLGTMLKMQDGMPSI